MTDWDALAVDAPGGHVYQSVAWAASSGAGRLAAPVPRHARRRPGPRPRAGLAAGGRVQRVRPARPGRCRRTEPTTTARRRSPDGWSRSATPWRPAASTSSPPTPRSRPPTRAYGEAIRAAGFAPIEEIQPSRHRIALPLEPGSRRGAASSRRSRSPRASGSGRREATGSWSSATTDARRAACPVTGSRRPAEPSEVALDRFYDLLPRDRANGGTSGSGRATASSRGGPRRCVRGTSSTSRPATRAPSGAVLAGLVLYRHGGRLSTVHSGDHAATRDHPSRRAAPAPLAGDPAGRPRGVRGDGPRRRGRRGRAARTRSRASRCTGSTSTSARSAAGGSS